MTRPLALRRGVSRLVLLIGPWAVKLPCWWYDGEPWYRPRDGLLLLGLLGNTLERDRYRRSGRHPRLAPVVACLPFGLLLVMKRCEPLAERALTPEELATLPLAHVDQTAGSIALGADGPVVVDYGNVDQHLVLPAEERRQDGASAGTA